MAASPVHRSVGSKYTEEGVTGFVSGVRTYEKELYRNGEDISGFVDASSI